MASDDQLVESEILVDSYGAASPLVRLAQLVAPACRVEPQLLRRVRLACVPEADVSVEQELWHSELVNERGKTLTFREGVGRVLRARLKTLRAQQPDLVARARRLTTDLHAGLSPLLILEDQLAWAEVFDEMASIGSAARTLLDSLLARREGIDYWLGRAWSGLPADLKQRPEGRALAQVAAAKGARVDEAATAAGADAVAHVLPQAPLLLKLSGLQLEINARPSEATHVIEVPQTQPRAVSVISAGSVEDIVVAANQTKTVRLRPGTVVIRTLSGAEYELEASGEPSAGALEVELLPAGRGTSVLIRYGDGVHWRRILVDCGDRRSGGLLVDRLQQDIAAEPIEVLVLTHPDDDKIGGALPLLDSGSVRHVKDVWFNALRQLQVVRKDLL